MLVQEDQAAEDPSEDGTRVCLGEAAALDDRVQQLAAVKNLCQRGAAARKERERAAECVVKW